jgi:LPS sulfotransferase NodH
MEAMSKTNGILEETFALFGIEPMRITYEELAVDPPGVAAAAAAYLGLKESPISDRRFVKPPMERQASELNARWEARFLEERGSEFTTTSLSS